MVNHHCFFCSSTDKDDLANNSNHNLYAASDSRTRRSRTHDVPFDVPINVPSLHYEFCQPLIPITLDRPWGLRHSFRMPFERICARTECHPHSLALDLGVQRMTYELHASLLTENPNILPLPHPCQRAETVDALPFVEGRGPQITRYDLLHTIGPRAWEDDLFIPVPDGDIRGRHNADVLRNVTAHMNGNAEDHWFLLSQPPLPPRHVTGIPDERPHSPGFLHNLPSLPSDLRRQHVEEALRRLEQEELPESHPSGFRDSQFREPSFPMPRGFHHGFYRPLAEEVDHYIPLRTETSSPSLESLLRIPIDFYAGMPLRWQAASSSTINALPTKKISAADVDEDGTATCAICTESVPTDEIVTKLPGCCHWFHSDCVKEWLSNNGTCPMCRARVSGEDDRVEATQLVLGAIEGRRYGTRNDRTVRQVVVEGTTGS